MPPAPPISTRWGSSAMRPWWANGPSPVSRRSPLHSSRSTSRRRRCRRRFRIQCGHSSGACWPRRSRTAQPMPPNWLTRQRRCCAMISPLLRKQCLPCAGTWQAPRTPMTTPPRSWPGPPALPGIQGKATPALLGRPPARREAPTRPTPPKPLRPCPPPPSRRGLSAPPTPCRRRLTGPHPENAGAGQP